MPFGATVVEGGVLFRLWAPAAHSVDLCLQRKAEKVLLPMEGKQGGWYELLTVEASVGSLYRYRINGDMHVPDPASRFQPEDVGGPSEVIDSTT